MRRTAGLLAAMILCGCSGSAEERGIAQENAFSVSCAGSTGNFDAQAGTEGDFSGVLTIDPARKQVYGSNVRNSGKTWRFLFLNNEIVPLVALDRTGIVFDSGEELEIDRRTGKMKVSFVDTMDIACRPVALVPFPKQTI